jgi:hypothetical protein
MIMSEKTFTVVGTAVNADGTVKPRWANDLAARVKILDKAGCTDIKLHELPSGMTKLAALEWLRANTELNDVEAEVVDLKIAEKSKAGKRAEVKATITKNVKTKAKSGKSDPKVEEFIEKELAEAIAE